jgi:hypothetical protein
MLSKIIENLYTRIELLYKFNSVSYWYFYQLFYPNFDIPFSMVTNNRIELLYKFNSVSYWYFYKLFYPSFDIPFSMVTNTVGIIKSVPLQPLLL